MNSPSFIDLTSTNARLMLCGEDKVDLLDRLSTNDISVLKEHGQGLSTVLTTNKGRIIDLIKIYFFEDHLLLVSDMQSISKISEWIEFYTIMEDVTQIDVSDETFQIRIFTDDINRIFPQKYDCEIDNFFVTVIDGVSVSVTRNKMNTKQCFDIFGNKKHKNRITQFLNNFAMQLESSQFENLRILVGYPKFGNELTEEFNPLEALLDDHISFNKGCYIGQEVVARLNTYNKVQRQMVQISSNHDLDIGEIEFGGQTVGTITSVMKNNGIAYINKKILEETSQVQFGSFDVEIHLI
ncbi:MAG: hypothetical protein CL734_06605 [Chloroflexi bacterium]|nr:hypothetical protein [Chloroflexota bacterium]